MRRPLACSFLLSFCLPVALQAADAVPVAVGEPFVNEPSPERFGWDGAYAGVQLGYGFPDPPGSQSDGLIGGAHAGYLWQYGGFVAGPEIDIDATDLKAGDLDVNAIARAKLRAGVAVDRWLVTGSIGYARAWTANPELEGGGLVFGAGVDYAVTNNVLVGADYIYQDIQNMEPSRIDLKAHTLRARFGYKF